MNNKPKIIIVMQARLSSSRLPGKVLRLLNGQPMLLQIYKRLSAVKLADEIVLSTSNEMSDDGLVEFMEMRSIKTFRAPLDDIAERMYSAAHGAKADILARIWCDCPLIAPEVVDAAIQKLIDDDLDFLTTADKGFPAGVGVEVYKTATFKKLIDDTDDPKLREFPVEWVKKQGNALKYGELKYEGEDLSSWYLTVDYPEDLVAMEQIYKALEQEKLSSSLADLIKLIKSQPELLAAFPNAPRNIEYVAYLKSLKS